MAAFKKLKWEYDGVEVKSSLGTFLDMCSLKALNRTGAKPGSVLGILVARLLYLTVLPRATPPAEPIPIGRGCVG